MVLLVCCYALGSPSAWAYCWTGTGGATIIALQREVERDPGAARQRVDSLLSDGTLAKSDPDAAAWLYAIRAAAEFQLNGSTTIRQAATRGLALIHGRNSSAEPDLRLALLNSMSTPEDMRASIPRFNAIARRVPSTSAKVCVTIFRGMARSDLMDTAGALTDLTTAYAASKRLPQDFALLKAFAATRMASALMNRNLTGIAIPLFDEARAEYHRSGATFSTLAIDVFKGLSLSWDGQSQAAVSSFRNVVRSPHADMVSGDILTVVYAHLCRLHTLLDDLRSAKGECRAAERLLHERQSSNWALLQEAKADLALKENNPGQALQELARAAEWRPGAPVLRDYEAKVRAYAALGDYKSATRWLMDYVRLGRQRDRDDRKYVYEAWRAQVEAFATEMERQALDRRLAVARERQLAEHNRAIIITIFAISVIALLVVILALVWRSRRRTVKHGIEIQRQVDDKIAMLAHVSHEIRSPLGSITLLAHSFGNRAQVSEQDREILSRMTRNGKRIARLLEDMLAYSRLEAGRIALMPTDVALRPLLDDVAATYRREAENRGLSLEIDVPSDVPDTIICDGDRVQQILDNLFANAVRFTDHGQIILRADFSAESHLLSLDVEDTGIGIPADQLSTLFREYHQIRSPDHGRGGTGLGLVISRRMAEALGGQLDLKPRPGGGLIASLLLPVGAKKMAESMERPDGRG